MGISSGKGSRRKICLFGTSANPPTGYGGHLGIVSYLAHLKNSYVSVDGYNNDGSSLYFDEVIVFPVYRHMFETKQKDTNGNFEHRMNMSQLAFQNISNVFVSDIEKKCFERVSNMCQSSEDYSKIKVGTVDLLDMLYEQNNNDRDYTLVFGSDTFLDLIRGKWKRTNDIINMVEGRIIVIPRMTNSLDGKHDNHVRLQFEIDKFLYNKKIRIQKNQLKL